MGRAWINSKLNRTLFGVLMLALITSGQGYAQQEMQLSQYMFNTLGFNPGYAGMSGGLCASATHRQQWFGMSEGSGDDKTNVSPNTTLVIVDAPIKVMRGGIGLTVASDNLAYFRNVIVKAGYSYYLKTGFGNIGLGLQVGFSDYNLDFGKLKPVDPNDPVVSSSQGKKHAFYTDLSIGAYLLGNKNYFAGISMNQIITQNKDVLHFKTERTMNVHGGYTFGFAALPILELTPMARLMTDFKTYSLDITAMATIQKKYWCGLSYRLRDAVTILAGLDIYQFRIGVSYDVSTTSMFKAGKIGGGFEIFLKYCFDLSADKVNTNYKNSRYL